MSHCSLSWMDLKLSGVLWQDLSKLEAWSVLAVLTHLLLLVDTSSAAMVQPWAAEYDGEAACLLSEQGVNNQLFPGVWDWAADA